MAWKEAQSETREHDASEDEDEQLSFDKPPKFDAPESPEPNSNKSKGKKKTKESVTGKARARPGGGAGPATASKKGRKAVPCGICGQPGHTQIHCPVL
eukprot:2565559-Rhodomonas_salina.1